MKYKSIFVTATCIFAIYAGSVSAQQEGRKLRVVSEHRGSVIGPHHPDVIASGNRSGFETGQVVKIDGTYHMFVNEMFGRPHRDLRIAHWVSGDAVDWQRRSTIVGSIAPRSPSNPRSEVWCTSVVFNDVENAWNIFYTAYRAGDKNAGEDEERDYAGRIWRAKSIHRGLSGIGGPYADMGIVLEPDENSQEWEGQQAVSSFHPYKAGDQWYAFYGGHYHTPKGPWPCGLASSPALAGPWTRLPVGTNPLPIVTQFIENPVVTYLNDGRFMSVFDSYGDQEIGYSFSDDGLAWDKETRLKVQSGENVWTHGGNDSIRTPLCAIREHDGTYTIIYTAHTKTDGKSFYAVGKCSVILD